MKYIIYSICALFFLSCNDGKINSKQAIKKPQLSQIKKHVKISKIQAKYQTEIEEWQEYENFSVFLNQFASISPNDALNNSRELNDLAKNLVDGLKPVIFETPAFNARVNLLFNQTLRLYDMSSIPAIKAHGVNNQIDKVLNAFSSINSKVNTTLKQRELELSVEDISFKKETSNKNSNTEVSIKKFTPRSKKKTTSKRDLKKNFSKKSQKKRFFEKDLLKEKKKNNLKRKKDVTKKTN